jgi:uncharacterized membrane protein
MDVSVGGGVRQQKAGGLAALYLALAYVVAMPYFLVFVKYPSVVDPVEKVALLVGSHASMTAMYLITYVILGIVLGVLALALYARLKDRAPTLAQAATRDREGQILKQRFGGTQAVGSLLLLSHC